ncbi:beta-ketoacyl-[acyl-carrier-protein] synthase family protein [Kitasatospora acidiphila]|uniref:beta-ketoacyl-[acyl-carrier-protein] synthase family protein n=1 Tax=Kitasatospora acidiphila TaxID=2567942 RepID=UPI003C79468C
MNASSTRTAGGPTAVTGIGMVTPGGVDAASTWRSVLAGRPTAAVDPALSALGPLNSCRVPDFDSPVLNRKGRQLLDPVSRFALAAVAEALQDAALDPLQWDPPRVAVIVGNCTGGTATVDRGHLVLAQDGPSAVSPYLHPAGLANMAGAQISLRFRAMGPCLTVNTACSSGADAIGLANTLLHNQVCDIAVACGSEAAISPLMASGFHRINALSRNEKSDLASRPFDRDRDGFVLAEGAAALVLERPEHAEARNARVRGRLLAHAATCDSHHVTAPHPEAMGAEAAIRDALRAAGAAPADVGHVNAHGTSTKLNDRVEAALLTRLFPHRPPVTSVKGALGHALGAAGAIEAALTVLTLEHAVVPPTAGLDVPDADIDIDVVTRAARPHRAQVAVSNSSGFGGHNAALVFAVP